MTTEGTKTAHGNPGKVPIGVGKHNGKWRAAPPSPHVQRGADVTWSFSPCNTWSLSLPGAVFDGELNPQGNGPGGFTSSVKITAPLGPQTYNGKCDGQDIEGNSPPSVIVDP